MPIIRTSLLAASILFANALFAAPPTDPPAVHPELWPQIPRAVPADRRIEKNIERLLRKMTVEEKVGQTIQGSIIRVTPDDVRTYHLGSVLNGGGGWPGDVRTATPHDWLARADEYYDASMDSANGRTPVPIIWGADAVHGHNNIVGATIFPHNVGLGAMHDPDLMRRIGEVTAAEMNVTGTDWNFSPTVAVARDDRWGRAYESWSEDPKLVRAYAEKIIEGLQGSPKSSDFLGRSKVIATAKHFLGDGGTTGGRDQGDNAATEAELRDIHAAGYIGAMSSGVQAVMASFNSWHGVKMHGNGALLTDVLKKRMQFDGIVVGDWNGHGQVPGCTNSDCPQALNAGLDMYMVPEDWKALYENTLAEVKSGAIPMARLDDAVRRILRVKLRAGLFTAGKPSSRPLGGDLSQLGSPAHRKVARQAVRESLVLLKNNGHVLPLDPKRNVLVAGDADNVPKQCGGWTLSWQGDGNSNADFPGSTSIWSGIRSTVRAAGGHATFSPDGSFATRPDVAIVVFGEDPYAEFAGDRPNALYRDDRALQILKRLREAGVPVISLFLSGRALWVNPLLNASDAFVAAWLPGTEGGGVADVLFAAPNGKPRHDFQGKLAFSWPKLPTQSVLNAGDAGYDPLFPLGYGLTYKDRTDVPELSVDMSGVSNAGAGVYIAGDVVEPFKMYIDDASAAPVEVGGFLVTSGRGTVSVQRVPRSGGLTAARLITWNGATPGRAFVTAAKPVDLSRESNGDMAMSFEVLLEKQPTRPVAVGVACGTACAGNVDIAPLLKQLPPGQWQTMRVRLRCFDDAGADMTRVDSPLMLSTDGELGLTLGDVKLVAATTADACPASIK